MGVDVIIEELNRLYQYDMDKYLVECSDLKRFGYKIYRNPEGKHKVVEPVKKKNKYNFVTQDDINQPFDINQLFGGIFGDIFKGGN